MGYKTFVSLNIAIVGEGESSERMATIFSHAGHEIFMGLADEKTACCKSYSDYDSIMPCSIEYAASVADVIILNTPSFDVREKAYLLDDVRKKVIIDFTSNFPSSTEEINTVNAIKAITGSQHVVKCYNSKTYKHLLSPLFKNISIDLFLAGDSRKAKEVVKVIARDMGFSYCYDFGDGNSIQLLDEMAKCWHKLASMQYTPKILSSKAEKK